MALYKEKPRTTSGKIKRERESRKGICFNTGRTHFKKGITPWNKGKKGMPLTEKQKAQYERMRGKRKPKPDGFSEKMRLINPPLGRKQPKDGRNIHKKARVSRGEYVMIYKPEHPSSRKKAPDYGYVLEHRYIMEKHLGRPLKKKEVIHHIDGDKANNNIDNLVLCDNAREHNIIHTEMELFVEKLIKEKRVKYDREAKEFVFV
jgi:hypothetical protein